MHKNLYSNKMKNWEFDKEVPSFSQIRRATVFIDTERGEDEKTKGKLMQSKTNSSYYLSIFALSLIAAPGLMAQNAPDTTQTQEQTGYCNTCSCSPCCCERCCTPKPKKCIDCECYTPQFYDLQCDCGFFVDAEFLYWYARETNLSYALKIQSKESTNVPPEDSPLFRLKTLVFAPQTYEHLSTKWDPGFRVGVGFNSECDGWDYYLNWTYFHNKKSNSISVSPDYGLKEELKEGRDEERLFVPFFAENQECLLLNPWINASFHGIGGGFIGQFSVNPIAILFGGGSSILSFDKINAKWRLSFNSIDLELGRKYWLSRCFNLRPYAGLRGAWTRTTFQTKSFRNASGIFSGIDFALDVTLKDRFKTRNWGAGLLGGIQPTWYFCNNFALYSNFDMALLWGEFENKKREKYRTVTNLIAPEEFQFLSITITDPSYSNLSKSKFFQMNALLDMSIGFRWEENWCCDQYRTTVDIGWEHHIWFDHNHRNKTSGFISGGGFETFDDSGQQPLSQLKLSPNVRQGNLNQDEEIQTIVNVFSEYDEVTGNLGYGGLVVRLRFDF